MNRRLLARVLLGVGVVLSMATSTREERVATDPETAEVSSDAVVVGDPVSLDAAAPLLLQVTVNVEGAFTQGGASLGPGEAALVVELEGEWSWLGGFELWEVADAADACVPEAGVRLRTASARDGLARAEAPVESGTPLLVAVRVKPEDATFTGALRVAAKASVTGAPEAAIGALDVTPSVEATLLPVDCAADTADTADSADTAAP